MLICSILILLLVVGVILAIKNYWNMDITGGILAFVCCALLIVAVGKKVNNHFVIHAEINQFVATKITIESARNNGIDFENAAIQHKIIESNQWLAKNQYYKTTVWSWWIPYEIDNLEPIR